MPSTSNTSPAIERSLQKMQIYAVCLIKMHPAEKKENIQWVLMHGIIILKLPFVVCVSSGLGVMKWLWHFISDSCEDDKGIECRWFGFITGMSEQLFIWISLSLTATLSRGSSAVKQKTDAARTAAILKLQSLRSLSYQSPFFIPIYGLFFSCVYLHSASSQQISSTSTRTTFPVLDSDYLHVHEGFTENRGALSSA